MVENPMNYSGEYFAGQEAYEMRYGFDPETKSEAFMEGYEDAKDEWERKTLDLPY